MYSVNQSRKCGNCNTNQKPRQWPVYNDECSASGSKGHWAKCRKTKHLKEDRRQSRHHKSKCRNYRHPHQRRVEHRRQRCKENINCIDVESVEENYLQHFHSISVSEKCIDSITGQPRDKVFITLNIRPPHLKYKTHHTLPMKINSSAFQQIHGTSPKALTILRPTHIRNS